MVGFKIFTACATFSAFNPPASIMDLSFNIALSYEIGNLKYLTE